jgi:hypothetical protein
MVSIAEAERIRRERFSKSRTRAGETRKRRSKAATVVLQPVLQRVAAEHNEVMVMISYLISYTISYHTYI